MKNINKVVLLLILFSVFTNCKDNEDQTKYEPPTIKESTHPNDSYLTKNMFEEYGTAVRWRWDNRFIKPNQSATPVAADYVIPVTKIVKSLWIGAYESQGKAGKDFIEKLFPAELQYIGSYIYQDGSVLLGYAEGGARITLLNLNKYNLKNRDWLTKAGGGILATVHHEFSHIVHQNYGMPPGFNKVSEKYLGNGWKNNVTLEDAIKLGMVRNYGAMNEFEDFCEIISHFLTLPKEKFEKMFIEQEDCSKLTDPKKIRNCQELNAGREKIATKLGMIIDFYKNQFGLDMVAVRDSLEKKIDYVVENNKIPE